MLNNLTILFVVITLFVYFGGKNVPKELSNYKLLIVGLTCGLIVCSFVKNNVEAFTVGNYTCPRHGSCSDSSSIAQTQCEGGGGTWTPRHECAKNACVRQQLQDYGHTDGRQAMNLAQECRNEYDTFMAEASGPATGFTTLESERVGFTVGSYTCGHGSPGSCSDSSSTTQGDCEGNGGRWTPPNGTCSAGKCMVQQWRNFSDDPHQAHAMAAECKEKYGVSRGLDFDQDQDQASARRSAKRVAADIDASSGGAESNLLKDEAWCSNPANINVGGTCYNCAQHPRPQPIREGGGLECFRCAMRGGSNQWASTDCPGARPPPSPSAVASGAAAEAPGECPRCFAGSGKPAGHSGPHCSAMMHGLGYC